MTTTTTAQLGRCQCGQPNCSDAAYTRRTPEYVHVSTPEQAAAASLGAGVLVIPPELADHAGRLQSETGLVVAIEQGSPRVPKQRNGVYNPRHRADR